MEKKQNIFSLVKVIISDVREIVSKKSISN